MRLLIMAAILIVATQISAAEPMVRVMALFSNKAMLQINGKNHILKKGQNLNGVTLLSANGRAATIRFDNGLEKSLGLNQSIQQAYKKPVTNKMTLYANRSGMFMTGGRINGQTTKFMVDTGATYVALSSTEADKLNLEFKSAPKVKLQTANEVASGWLINLESVKVGEIQVPQVKAVVMEGDTPHVLLGMSFLQHLKMERNGTAMTLEQKFK